MTITSEPTIPCGIVFFRRSPTPVTDGFRRFEPQVSYLHRHVFLHIGCIFWLRCKMASKAKPALKNEDHFFNVRVPTGHMKSGNYQKAQRDRLTSRKLHLQCTTFQFPLARYFIHFWTVFLTNLTFIIIAQVLNY